MKGRAARKSGGKADNFKSDKDGKKDAKMDKDCAKKDGGSVSGGAAPASAARSPRKSGGRTGSNMNPLSSAASGTNPKGHSTPGSK